MLKHIYISCNANSNGTWPRSFSQSLLGVWQILHMGLTSVHNWVTYVAYEFTLQLEFRAQTVYSLVIFLRVKSSPLNSKGRCSKSGIIRKLRKLFFFCLPRLFQGCSFALKGQGLNSCSFEQQVNMIWIVLTCISLYLFEKRNNRLFILNKEDLYLRWKENNWLCVTV